VHCHGRRHPSSAEYRCIFSIVILGEDAGDYEYRVWRDMAGPRRLVRRREIRSHATGTVIAERVSFESESVAKDAISVIRRLSFERES
jgi:hypothetical protein